MIQLCRMNSTAEVKASTRASPSRRRCPCTSRCSQRPAGSVAVMAWRPSSVVTLAGTHLAAEYPVGPGGIGEDDGNHEEHADQQEQLRPRGGGRSEERRVGKECRWRGGA